MAKARPWADDDRAKLRARLTDWDGILGRQPQVARQIVRKLLEGRLTLVPDAAAAFSKSRGERRTAASWTASRL